ADCMHECVTACLRRGRHACTADCTQAEQRCMLAHRTARRHAPFARRHSRLHACTASSDARSCQCMHSRDIARVHLETTRMRAERHVCNGRVHTCTVSCAHALRGVRRHLPLASRSFQLNIYVVPTLLMKLPGAVSYLVQFAPMVNGVVGSWT